MTPQYGIFDLMWLTPDRTCSASTVHPWRARQRPVPLQMVYSSLPNFEEREEDFRAESVLLRRRFTDESMLAALLPCCQLDMQHGVQSLLWECRRPRKRPSSRCSHADEDTLVRLSRDKLPGDALALSLQKVWEVIRDQKDLNLPAHKVQHRDISGQTV